MSSSSLRDPVSYIDNSIGMLARAFNCPYSEPFSVLHELTKSDMINGTDISESGVIAVTTQVPPLRVIISASGIKSVCRTPTVRITASAITPQVSSLTSARAAPASLTVCVAPNDGATPRLKSTGSTATMHLAPAARAPCTAFIPTPPVPTTTTVSPGLVPAQTLPDPKPVVTPQDTRDAASSGIQSCTLMNDRSEATTYSEKVPTCIKAIRSWSPRWRRGVPSVIM